MTKHLAVWLDQAQARIFHLDPERIEEETLTAPPHRLHSKHPKRVNNDGEPRASKRFLREIAKELEGAEEVLVTGPSTTKHEFFKFLHKHDPTLEPKIVGIESITDTSDGNFLRYAQQYFKLSDPMR
jgi:stalled ribosome rescue protein Dom34